MYKLTCKFLSAFICIIILATLCIPVNGKVSTAKQVVNIALNENPLCLDPSFDNGNASKQIQNEIYEGLTRQFQKDDGTYYIEPAGASKWEVSKNLCAWTFYLRDNYWSDGVKVTATHYIDSILRTLDPKTNSPYAYILYVIKNAKAYNSGKLKDKNKVGLKAIASNKLEITLEAPCPYFLELTHINVMKPQRLDFIKKFGNKYAYSEPTTISCGPFEVAKWTINNTITLGKNAKYWDKNKIQLTALNFKISENVYENFNGLFENTIQISRCNSPSLIDKLKDLNKHNYKNINNGSTVFTFFNLNSEYFKSKKIRQAFIIAEDRKKLIDDYYNELGETASGLCPSTVTVGSTTFRNKSILEPLEKLSNENGSPKELLIQGLKELGKSSAPKDMDLTFLQAGNSPIDIKFAECIKTIYDSALGTDIKIKYLDWDEYDECITKGNYEMSSIEWFADYNDPINFFEIFKNDYNFINTGFKNKEFDSLIAKASVTTNLTERIKLLRNVEDILIRKDSIISPTIYKNDAVFYSKSLKNLQFNRLYGMEFKYTYLE